MQDETNERKQITPSENIAQLLTNFGSFVIGFSLGYVGGRHIGMDSTPLSLEETALVGSCIAFGSAVKYLGTHETKPTNDHSMQMLIAGIGVGAVTSALVLPNL